jgi:SAM-dependent methyltransferase
MHPELSAKQFNKMSAASDRFPIWYWNRFVLTQLRLKVDTLLSDAGVGAGSKVLEIGCGNRAYERLVKARQADYCGADFPDNKHADLVLSPQGTLAVPDGSFDAILSIQVLEHVLEPAAHLAEVQRLLKPGGVLILSTHGMWEYHPAPLDYWRWTSEGLKKVLRDNHFQISRFHGIQGLTAGSVQIFQDSVRRRLPRLIRKAFTAICQFIISKLDRLHSDDSRAKNAMIYIALATSHQDGLPRR